MNETVLIGLVIVLGLIVLASLILGFMFLLTFASEQGFVGLAVLVACWVFMFPVMLVISGIIGFVLLLAIAKTYLL